MLQVEVSPEVLAFQAKVVAAVTTIIKWVEAYVPAQIGEGNYFPHLTVGVAKFDDLKIIEAEPFDPSTVHAAGVAIYHLGNNGTARVELKSWEL